MKNIFYILLLLPTIIFAQYPGNANQKITLGEQTTADGLVFRGVLNDTALITPLSDTSAYIILDTVNNKFYNYNRATNVWSVAGGGTAVTSITGGTGLTGGTITSTGTLAADTSFLFTQSDTLSLNLTNRFAAKQNNITLTTTGTSGAATLVNSTLNIPQYSGGGGVTDGDKGDIDVTNSGATWTIDTSAVSLSGNKVTGTLPVANGGTNASTFTAGSVVFAGSGGTYTEDNSNLFFDNTNNRLALGLTNPEAKLHIKSDVNGTSNMIFENLQGGPNSSAAIYLKTRNVAGNADVTGIITKTKTGGYYFDNNENSTNAFMQFSNYLTTWMYADGNGKVGIGTVSPTARLQVKGSANAAEFALRVEDSGNNNLLSVQNNGDVTLKNPLSVANGGTGSTTQNFVDLTTAQTVAGIKTFSNAMNVNGDLTLTASGFQPMIVRRGVKSIGAAVEVPMRLQNGTNNYVSYAALRAVIIDTTTNSEDGSFQIHTTLNGEQNGRFEVRNNGNVGIDLINDGITPSEKLHVKGNGLFTGSVTANSLSLTTPLPVANGGTGSATQNFVDLTTTQSSIGGAKTFTSVVTGTRFDPTANTVTGNGMYLPATNSLGFSTAGTQRIHINSAGKVGIGTQMTTAGTNDYGTLNVNGKLTFESEFFAYRSSGAETDGYSYFNLRDAGVSGAFGTGLTGQFEFYTYQGAGNINGFVIGNYQAKPFIIGTNAVERMRVTGDGEVNIGYNATDNGAYPLQVNGQIFATNATIATSDEKFKENITPLNKGIEIVNKLKPVTFNFISDTKNNFSEYEEVGFIAQDVDRALSTETFAKSIVKSADDSEPTSTMGLATQNLIPILVKAIQEQQALIKALEQRILILENK